MGSFCAGSLAILGGTRRRTLQIIVVGHRQQVAGEAHLCGAADVAALRRAESQEVLRQVVGDLRIHLLKRIGTRGQRRAVRVFAGERLVGLVEPGHTARVTRLNGQLQPLALRYQNRSRHHQIDGVGGFRHHAHGTPVASGLDHGLQQIGHVIALGASHLRIHQGLPRRVVGIGNVGGEYGDPHVETLVAGNFFLDPYRRRQVDGANGFRLAGREQQQEHHTCHVQRHAVERRCARSGSRVGREDPYPGGSSWSDASLRKTISRHRLTQTRCQRR